MTGRLADDGSIYFERFARFLRTALGTMTHNANNAANATPPSTASISEPPEQVVCNLFESIVKQLCFPNVAYMLNNCYIPPTFATSAESVGIASPCSPIATPRPSPHLSRKQRNGGSPLRTAPALVSPISATAPKANAPGAMQLVHLRVGHRAVFGFVQPNFLFLFRHAQAHRQIQNLEQDEPAAEAPNDCGDDARYLRH